MAPLPPQLVVLSGPYRGDVIVLDDPIPVVFGTRAGVCLPEPALDGVHCQVFLAEGLWFLQDFGSEAGTWLGDERVQGVQPLPDGQSFRIGETHVGLVKPDPRAPATDSAEVERAADSDELEPVDLSRTAEFKLTLDPSAPASAVAEEVLPDAVGGYTIRRLLGRGPLGPVYEAFDPRRQRVVALKLLAPELSHSRRAVTRFLSGAKACGRLQHPNLVAVHAAGHTAQRIYMALEHVDGADLETVCERAGGRLPAREAVALAAGVAEGLVYMHGRGVLHRNVKPRNILVGPGRWPKLSDPSFAKREGGDGDMQVTGSDDVLVQSPYAAPESVFDARHVDARADVFAVAATLYRALAGQPPYPAHDPAALVRGEFTDPRERAPGLSDALRDLLARALKPQPDDRFQSMAHLRDALVGLPEATVA